MSSRVANDHCERVGGIHSEGETPIEGNDMQENLLLSVSNNDQESLGVVDPIPGSEDSFSSRGITAVSVFLMFISQTNEGCSDVELVAPALLFPTISQGMSALVPSKWRTITLAAYSVCSAALYIILIHLHAFGASVEGYSEKPQALDCRNYYWSGSDACGPQGMDCLPFTTVLRPYHFPILNHAWCIPTALAEQCA